MRDTPRVEAIGKRSTAPVLWGIGAMVATFGIGVIGALVGSETPWFAVLLLLAGGSGLMSRERWASGVAVLLGTVAGIAGFLVWLIWELNAHGVGS